MKNSIQLAVITLFITFSVTACLSTGSSTTGQSTVSVSEMVSICGAVLGGDAEARINQEWEKYPEAAASRPVVENMAQVLLVDSTGATQESTADYKKYITCATGLMMTNGLLK